MALARWLGSWWWIPGAAVFTAIASALVLTGPYLTPGLEKPDDAELVRTYERFERAQGVSGIPLRIEEVSGDTSQANAYAFGMGPTSTIVLWDTLLDGRFTDGEVHVVLAHELAHHSSEHLPEAVAWFGLFALPGGLLIMLATRRRGGMGEAAAVPLALLVAAVFQLAVAPAQNVVSRRVGGRGGLEGAADDPRPGVGAGPLPRVRRDVARRPEPADLGLRPPADAPDARAAGRDGRGLGGAAATAGVRLRSDTGLRSACTRARSRPRAASAVRPSR